MQQTTYKNVKVTYPDSMPLEQAMAITQAEKDDWWDNLNHMALGYLTITVDDEGIMVHGKEAEKIQRLRRITGYCAVLSHWNDAKIGELRDRVKHI